MYMTRPEEVRPAPLPIEGAQGTTFRVLIGPEQGAPHFAMRHFTVDPGGHTPLHQHPYEHEIVVQAGKGLVRCGDTYRGIRAGDAIFLPPGKLHQIRNTGTDPLEFICLVPVQFDCGDGSCQKTPGT